MSDCSICGGTGFVIVERGSTSAAKRCDCRKPAETHCAGKPVTPELATAATEALCDVLAFAPSTKLGRMVISNALIAICPSEDSVWWLVERACNLHTKWQTCGISGLRQIICSRHLPNGRADNRGDGSISRGCSIGKAAATGAALSGSTARLRSNCRCGNRSDTPACSADKEIAARSPPRF
jgi:hypothetical protein